MARSVRCIAWVERWLRRRVRENLLDWARVALAGQGLRPVRHQRVVIQELEGLSAGDWDRLMLLLPPGSAKSTYASQDNWAGTDILVPQASLVEWVGTWGGWQAVSFPLGDYLAPTGDGGLVLRSAANDIALRPAGSGRIRFSSDAELVGFATLLGRGSPGGVVAAPPGSDYRDLDGGAGTTFWVKQTGMDATGWVPLA